MADHNCGKFDASYVSIEQQKDGSWVLFINYDPELTIEFCPYCGVALEPSTTERPSE